MAEPERIVELLHSVSDLAGDKIRAIKQITGATRILALNALVEANRAGEAGKGFTVVAGEVKTISARISTITQELEDELFSNLAELTRLGENMVMHVRGSRLADLSLNMIDIIDRNLYERSCDVRWWATDSAVVGCLAERTPEVARYAGQRLGVILDSYTVYRDLWVADADGVVVANGRPETYPHAVGTNVSGTPWFRDAMATADGSHFAVADVAVNETLNGSIVATYSTAIREHGDTHGRPLGALGIFFDWQAQSQTVVDAVRLAPDEKARTRSLLIDRNHRVIAASDQHGVLREVFPLETSGGPMSSYLDENGAIVGYALTPGYETYKGLGWYGVIVQDPIT